MIPTGVDSVIQDPNGVAAPERRARLLLADDHSLISAAFENLLKPKFDVIENCSDGLSLLAAAERHNPDFIILDISMPRLNGLDTARRLRKMVPQCRLLFLTMNDDPTTAAEAFRIGASGYILKTSPVDELFQAIEQILLGRTYITPLIAEGMVRAMSAYHGEADEGSRISPRQRQVLQLLAEGNSMKEVARFLKISQRTVAFHKYRIMDQLKLKSTAELVRFAVKEGIVPA